MSGRADLPLVTDIASIFLDERPMLDVRAPVEFEQGAFPGAENRPLLTDEERHQVGIRYKEAGQDAAIALGYALVDAEEKARRVAEWRAFVEAHPQGLLYCFRGGLRSRLRRAGRARCRISSSRRAWRRTGSGRSPTARSARSRSVRTKPAGARTAGR